MVRNALIVVALIGVLLWTAMCGRSRNAPASDTPVPTLTALPTLAATATEGVTALPTTPPTEVPPTPTAEVVATEVITAMDALTETEVLTATEEVTEAASISESTEITEAAEITDSMMITETSAITEAEVITEEVASAVATTPTVEAMATEVVSATVDATLTPEPTDESPATVTVTVETPTVEAPTVEATLAATVETTATEDVTQTVALTATDVVSESVEISSTETASTPSASVVAQQAITLPSELATSVLISEVTLLTDLVGDALPSVAELSPDGSKVAWLVAAQARRLATLCVADVDADVDRRGENCVTAENYQGLPYHLVWSPDGLWIAFSEDSSAQALESDIWIFDVAKGEIVNRTDDAALGRYAAVDGEFALDYLPMWNPATGDLIFWRSTPDEEGGFALELMRLDPRAVGEAEVVRSFDGHELGNGAVGFGWQRFYLQGPTAISPDGSQLAVSFAPAQEMDLSDDSALWLIDLVDADAEPTQVATAFAWQSALPQWSNQPAVVRGLQWTADGKGVVVAALSNDLRLPLLLAYYMDVATREVTPVVSFSGSRDRAAFFRLDPTTGHAPRFDVPWTVALAPDANVLLMVTDLGGGVRVLGAPLPPTGEAPVVLHEHRSPGYDVWTRSSGGNDRVLVYGMLVNLSPD